MKASAKQNPKKYNNKNSAPSSGGSVCERIVDKVATFDKKNPKSNKKNKTLTFSEITNGGAVEKIAPSAKQKLLS